MPETNIIFTGLLGIATSGPDEIPLTADLSLCRPNERLLSARSDLHMSPQDFADGEGASRYLVCSYPAEVPGLSAEGARAKGLNRFYSGLMALQIIKPLSTLGFIYFSDSSFRPQASEHRPKMEPSQFALLKHFDSELLKDVPALIERIQQVTDGDSAERKNAIILLQHGLEHFHLPIAGLFWVMGMEAIFNSYGRQEFKKKLCLSLGSETRVFPEWTAPSPEETTERIAIELYTLRSKLAHGADLRKARKDDRYSFDLVGKKQELGFEEPVSRVIVLSEAALFLLCQVLQKELGRVAGRES